MPTPKRQTGASYRRLIGITPYRGDAPIAGSRGSRRWRVLRHAKGIVGAVFRGGSAILPAHSQNLVFTREHGGRRLNYWNSISSAWLRLQPGFAPNSPSFDRFDNAAIAPVIARPQLQSYLPRLGTGSLSDVTAIASYRGMVSATVYPRAIIRRAILQRPARSTRGRHE